MVQAPTVIDFVTMKEEIRLDNESLQQDLSPENIARIDKRTAARETLLKANYTKDMSNDLARVAAFKDNQSLGNSLKNFISEDFPADSTLDPKAFEKFNRVYNIVKKTQNSKESEAASMAAISSLYLRDDKSGRKYISKDHPLMKTLWALYYNTTSMNYVTYFMNETGRNEKRDEFLKNKLINNKSKLSGPTLQAVINLGF